ncbi:MAG: DUF2806 domain-containing protein [Rudaea sp.]
MTGNGGLINLGEISKPATVLIERISDAVGGIAQPWQIKRVARAEAEASLIQANARVQISELEHRALIRMIREEGAKQENIEVITAQAVPQVSDHATPENIERDWLTQFFDRCRLISDEKMQSLWSSILAGEANAPGTFSKRTIELVATLDKRDAELFSKLCSYLWFFFGVPVPLIFDVTDSIYKNGGITFDALTHLDSLGLVRFDGVVGHQRNGVPKQITCLYFDQPLVIEFSKNEQNTLLYGKTLLTQSGEELTKIVEAKALPEFKDYATGKFKSFGYKILS